MCWSLLHDQCKKCGTSGTAPKERHGAIGLCVACYARMTRLWQGKYLACRKCGGSGTTGGKIHWSGGICRRCHAMANISVDR
jgi:hypothetical protein